MKTFKIKILFIPIVFTFVAVFYLFLQPWGPLVKSELGHLLSTIVNMNKFSLELSNDIAEEKVQIEWNDLLIFDGEKFIQRNINRKRNVYGENTFTVKYNSEVIKKVVQYKFNNWHYNNNFYSR